MSPFQVLLTQKLEKEIVRLKDEISAGLLVDHVAYKTYCAQISAYRRIIDEFIPETLTDLEKR